MYCTWQSNRSNHATEPDIGRDRDVGLPHLHLTSPLGGGRRRNIATTFDVEKLEWYRYPMVKKIEDIVIRLDKIHERNGRTDGHRMTA